jgi:hypothetical protein
MIAGLGLWYSASDPAYDAFTYEQAIPTLFDASGNGWNAAQATGSNQARFLTHDGRNYLRAVAATNNVARTPTKTGFNVDDLDFEIDFAAVSWTPVSSSSLASIYGSSGQRRWWLFVRSAGTLDLTHSFDGTATTSATSTAATGLAANTLATIRVTRSASTGNIVFYVNGVQLGAPVATDPGPLFGSSAGLVLGNISSEAALPLAGRNFGARLRDGINGTLVADFDPSRGNFNSATIGSATGETWTINKSGLDPAMIVSARAFLPLTDDRYRAAGAVSILAGAPGATLVASCATTQAGAQQELIAIGTNTGSVNRALLYSTSADAEAIGGRRDDSDSFVAITAELASRYEFQVRVGVLNAAAATASLYANGVQGATGAWQTPGDFSNTNSNATPSIFSSLSLLGANFFSGPVTDLCLYRAPITNAQIFSLSRYFAGRTGGAVTV